MSDNTKFNEIIKKAIDSEKIWSKIIRDISDRLRESNVKHVSEIQADTINNRQLVVDEISIYGVKIWKEKQILKKLEKTRFEFYATSYPIKTSGTEKLRLIQSDLSDRQYIINRYEEHVEFLRNASKNLDALNFGCKNKIELYNILGGYE